MSEAAPAPAAGGATGLTGTPAPDAGAPAPQAAPPAAPAPLTGTPPPEGAPQPTGDQWFSKIENTELRGFAESKNWATLDQALEGYQNLEKMRGVPEDQLLRIPAAEDAEGMKAMYKRLGTPEEAKGYDIGIEHGDTNQWMFDLFHEAGATNAQAKTMAAGYDKWFEGQVSQNKTAMDQQAQIDLQDINREWGANAQANHDAAQRMVQRMGFSEEQVAGLQAALGVKGTYQMMADLGRATGEMAAVRAGETQQDAFQTMSPEAAQAKYAEMKGDADFKARLYSKDKHVREVALAERTKISKLAHNYG